VIALHDGFLRGRAGRARCSPGAARHPAAGSSASVVPTGYARSPRGSTPCITCARPGVFVAQVGGVDMTWGEQLQAIARPQWSRAQGLAGVSCAPRVRRAAQRDPEPFHLSGRGRGDAVSASTRIMDAGRTCVNVVGNCVRHRASLAVWERRFPADGADLPAARASGGRFGAAEPRRVVNDNLEGSPSASRPTSHAIARAAVKRRLTLQMRGRSALSGSPGPSPVHALQPPGMPRRPVVALRRCFELA